MNAELFWNNCVFPPVSPPQTVLLMNCRRTAAVMAFGVNAHTTGNLYIFNANHKGGINRIFFDLADKLLKIDPSAIQFRGVWQRSHIRPASCKPISIVATDLRPFVGCV